jgi:hypothetical protein
MIFKLLQIKPNWIYSILWNFAQKWNDGKVNYLDFFVSVAFEPW